jgi:hypothetical protein
MIGGHTSEMPLEELMFKMVRTCRENDERFMIPPNGPYARLKLIARNKMAKSVANCLSPMSSPNCTS